MTSYLRQIDRDPNGSLYISFNYVFNPSFRLSFGHLEEVWVDERYILAGDIMRFLGRPTRALGRGEIIAFSGNSGIGPKEYGGVQPPHLHLSLHYWDGEKRVLESLDPEKHGMDGGKPVFWDGETVLDIPVLQRVVLLGKTMANLEGEVNLWPGTKDLLELKGILLEHRLLMGNANGKAVLDSKNFHDVRTLLKRITLEEKKYGPGAGPYRLMLKILGYSTEEKQRLILTLPFISPKLDKLYRKSVYEGGPFFTIRPTQE